MSDKYVAYVGTYTHGKSVGIHVCDVDVEKGTLIRRKVVPVNNCSYLTLSKSGKYLYSIADEGVAVFAIKPDGDLEMINKVGIDGMRGCYLSVDKDGKYLFVGGWHDGKVTMVHTHRDGRLGGIIDGVFHTGLGSVAERNFRPHVSCVVPTPDNKFVCAVDSGIDQVKIYRLRTMHSGLQLAGILRCDLESGPREMCFDHKGKYAYVIYELANRVDVFEYITGTKCPEFKKIQSIPLVFGDSDARHDAGAAMTMSPDGCHLFCTTAGTNCTTMYEIDQEDGTLTKEFCLPTSGAYPKDIMVFPDGKHIAVVNHESNSVTTFMVDYDKDVILMMGHPLELETPNCILFTKLAEQN